MAESDPASSQTKSIRDIADSLRVLSGTLRRGWRWIAAGTLVAIVCGIGVIAITERAYRATSMLLVLKHGSKPLSSVSGEMGFQLDAGEDYLSTHAIILASPMVLGRAIETLGLANLPSIASEENPLLAAVHRLRIRRPDRMAKILRVDFDARSGTEAVAMVEAIVRSYQEFLDKTYRRNNSQVATILGRAKEGLGAELDQLEKEYVKHRQERPVLATDETGRTFLQRRLDHWDRAANELMVKGVRLRAQNALAHKLADRGVGLAAVVLGIDQLNDGVTRGMPPQMLPAKESDFLRKLIEAEHELVDRIGPGATKVKQLRAQIQELQSGSRGAKSDLEKGDVADILTSTEESLKAMETMKAEIALQYDRELAAVKASDQDILNEANFKATLERRRLLFNSVVDQLKQAQITTDFTSISCDEIEPPTASDKPVRPRIFLTLAVSMILGMALGCVSAVVADRLDARIRSVGEMREALGLGVLGRIPRLNAVQAPTVREVGLFCRARPRSEYAEVYRSIRTYIDLSRRHRQLQLILVTSPLSSDGKTAVASNLAISLASSGRRVLLVDGNLRDPNLAGIHDLRRDLGMLDVLRDGKPLAEVAQRSSVENLDVVTAGLRAASPSELLAASSLDAFFKAARQAYDMTIIDSPPLMSVSDASILGASADGVLLVVRSLELDREDALRVSELLAAMETTTLGVVVNAVETRGATFQMGRSPAAEIEPADAVAEACSSDGHPSRTENGSIH